MTTMTHACIFKCSAGEGCEMRIFLMYFRIFIVLSKYMYIKLLVYVVHVTHCLSNRVNGTISGSTESLNINLVISGPIWKNVFVEYFYWSWVSVDIWFTKVIKIKKVFLIIPKIILFDWFCGKSKFKDYMLVFHIIYIYLTMVSAAHTLWNTNNCWYSYSYLCIYMASESKKVTTKRTLKLKQLCHRI